MSRTLFSIYYIRFLILLLIILHVSAHGTNNDDDDAASESSTKPNLRARSLILVKIWCLVLVFLGTFIGGLSPCFFKWNQGFLALGTQFSGGVFLGTALMHFLSDANETFEDLTSKEYPFAFMLASAGYLLTMLADCVIAGVYKRDKEVKENSGSDHTQLNKNYGFVEGGGVASAAKIDNDHTQNQQQQVQPCGGGGGTTDNSSSDHPHVAAISTMGDTILLIVALCFHSIFEGIAIGVAETTADAWKALWTISLHKIFAAIAMSIALLKMIPHRPILTCGAYAFAFAISSPIGVAIGIVIDQTTEGRVADWVFAISMGLACGVFVYVSINHLLSKRYYETSKEQEGGKVNSPYFRFLAVVLGVGVIAVVMIWDT